MKPTEKIREDIIEKIRSVDSNEVLRAIDEMLSSDFFEAKHRGLTSSQRKMLEMSEEDIKQDRLISHDAVMKRNLEWLNKEK